MGIQSITEQDSNRFVSYKVHRMEQKLEHNKDNMSRIQVLEARVNILEHKIDEFLSKFDDMFGGHVLIDGHLKEEALNDNTTP